MSKVMINFRKILNRFFWIPLGVGFAGYMMTGEVDALHALYASAALYFVNPVYDYDNVLILLAEILAVVVTTGAVLSLLGTAAKRIVRFFVRLNGDATVVYGDAAYASGIAEGLKHGYHIEDPARPEKVDTHIVCFEDDEKTLEFFSENKDSIASGSENTYLILNDIDPYLLSSTADYGVHYLGVSDLVARRFWHDHNLYERVVTNGLPASIAFVGEGRIISSLIRYAYLNLIYTTTQHIDLHVYVEDPAEGIYFAGLDTANDDKIYIHQDGWKSSLSDIRDMTYIVIAFPNDSKETLEVLQPMLRVSSSSDIYVYSEDDTDYTDVFDSDRLCTFGNIGELLTEDFIKNEPLDLAAKLFNYDYTLRATGEKAGDDFIQKAEEAWRSLNGFFRGSNTARADHHWIERRMAEDGIPDIQIEEVEHIRWCRFHYANGWTYAPVRDNKAKKHHFLVPFDELPEAEKRKDGIYDDKLRKEIERLCV